MQWAHKVQSLDMSKLEEHPLHQLPQKEATELLYESNQIVCVKGDNVKGVSENSFVLACLQENVEVNRKKVTAEVFGQDPFNPTKCLGGSGKYVEVESIMCILISYKDHQE